MAAALKFNGGHAWAAFKKLPVAASRQQACEVRAPPPPAYSPPTVAGCCLRDGGQPHTTECVGRLPPATAKGACTWKYLTSHGRARARRNKGIICSVKCTAAVTLSGVGRQMPACQGGRAARAPAPRLLGGLPAATARTRCPLVPPRRPPPRPASGPAPGSPRPNARAPPASRRRAAHASTGAA